MSTILKHLRAGILRAASTAAVALLLGLALLLPVRSAAADDLDTLVALAAKYESGGSAEPLRQFEHLLRDASGKPERKIGIEAAVIRLLAPDTTFEAKRFACQQLAVRGSDASLPALAELLKQEETVGMACFALGGMRSKKAGDVLRAALPDAEGTARLQLVSTLGHRAEAASVPQLVGLARESDAAVACAAIRALGTIDSITARAAVCELRHVVTPAAAVAVAVDEALLSGAEQLVAAGERTAAAAIGEELLKPVHPTHVRCGALSLLLRCDGDGGLLRARSVLAAAPPDEVLLPVATARVPELRGEGVSESFGDFLPRLPPAGQVLLIEALACRGDAAARRAIQDHIGSADPSVRHAAVAAFGRLGGTAEVTRLAQALAAAATPEESKDVQIALAGLRGNEATDLAICAALRQADANDKAPLMAVLSRRGGRAAVEALLGLAGGADEPVASAAARALARIAEGGDPASLDAVQAALADGDVRIREAALRTLVAWRGLAAWDTLVGIYLKSGIQAQHALALRGLVRIASEGNAQPDAAMIGRFRQLLAGARTDEDRQQILRVLAGVAHPDALALPLPLLDAPAVHLEAVETVKRIAVAIQKTRPEAADAALRRLADERNAPQN